VPSDPKFFQRNPEISAGLPSHFPQRYPTFSSGLPFSAWVAQAWLSRLGLGSTERLTTTQRQGISPDLWSHQISPDLI